MLQDFIYENPVKVYFGQDQLGHLVEELQRYGRRVLLVYGGGSIKATGLYDQVVKQLTEAGLSWVELGGIEPNPRHTSINTGGALCRAEEIDVILAIGGGSTLDAAKFISAAAFIAGDSWQIQTGAVEISRTLPVVTVVTLAATGSEMNGGGVITNLATGDKIGFKHPLLFPKVSFLDPTNTYTVGPYQSACGAVDIFAHVLETYLNPGEDMYMLDCFMEGLMKTVLRYGPVVLTEPTNYTARANLLWASSWGINGFARSCQTCGWSCHPIEHELSAQYDITHGLGLAILLPRYLRYTLDETSCARYGQWARAIFDITPDLDDEAAALAGISALETFFFETLGLAKSLSDIGIDGRHFAQMADKACHGQVLAGYRPLTPKDVAAILHMCL